MERLEKLIQLVNLGHSIGAIAHLPEKNLLHLLRKSIPRHTEKGDLTLHTELLTELRPALESFDIHAVSSHLDQKRTALGTRGFILQILVPLLQWMGNAVEQGAFSIAHEHALSAVLKDQIYQCLRYGSNPALPAAKQRFVLATPEDDLHELGVLMASALVVHHGLGCHFLGANLPVEALSLAVKAIRGTVVILGNSPVPEEKRSPSFERYLSLLHQNLPETVEIWIGGAGKVPHLRRVAPGRNCRVIHSLSELDTLLGKSST
jgi:methanogenic corrinoid protein MtbC1